MDSTRTTSSQSEDTESSSTPGSTQSIINSLGGQTPNTSEEENIIEELINNPLQALEDHIILGVKSTITEGQPCSLRCESLAENVYQLYADEITTEGSKVYFVPYRGQKEAGRLELSEVNEGDIVVTHALTGCDIKVYQNDELERTIFVHDYNRCYKPDINSERLTHAIGSNPNLLIRRSIIDSETNELLYEDYGKERFLERTEKLYSDRLDELFRDMFLESELGEYLEDKLRVFLKKLLVKEDLAEEKITEKYNAILNGYNAWPESGYSIGFYDPKRLIKSGWNGPFQSIVVAKKGAGDWEFYAMSTRISEEEGYERVSDIPLRIELSEISSRSDLLVKFDTTLLNAEQAEIEEYEQTESEETDRSCCRIM